MIMVLEVEIIALLITIPIIAGDVGRDLNAGGGIDLSIGVGGTDRSVGVGGTDRRVGVGGTDLSAGIEGDDICFEEPSDKKDT